MNTRTKKSQYIWLGTILLGMAFLLTLSGDSKAASTSLQDIIKAGKTWSPAFQTWYGQPAPDMTLRDLQGKKIQLSKLKGKDVLVVFWATWCGPCNREVPHLIELRKKYAHKKLEIIAISNESAAHLKRFAQKKKINYSVVSPGKVAMPAPFSKVRSIPTMFFIDKKGTVKLATSGLVSLAETKAIIDANTL
jgi:peroxiredoxin